jgi:hypothetical protein
MGRWAEAFQAAIVSRDTADSVDTSSAQPTAAKPCVNSVNSVNSVTRQERPESQETALPRDLVSTESAVSCPALNEINAGTDDTSASAGAAVEAWCEQRAAEALDGYEPPPPAPDWPDGRAPPPEFNRQIAGGYRRSALGRPPSWWRAEAHRPTPGAICSCCDGQRVGGRSWRIDACRSLAPHRSCPDLLNGIDWQVVGWMACAAAPATHGLFPCVRLGSVRPSNPRSLAHEGAGHRLHTGIPAERQACLQDCRFNGSVRW